MIIDIVINIVIIIISRTIDSLVILIVIITTSNNANHRSIDVLSSSPWPTRRSDLPVNLLRQRPQEEAAGEPWLRFRSVAVAPVAAPFVSRLRLEPWPASGAAADAAADARQARSAPRRLRVWLTDQHDYYVYLYDYMYIYIYI